MHFPYNENMSTKKNKNNIMPFLSRTPGIILFTAISVPLMIGCGTGKQQKQEKQPGTIAEKADAYLEALTRQEQFSGAVLMAKQGKILFKKGYGMANVKVGTANAPGTIFRIGSITKSLTAVLVMRLAAEGKITLKSKITDYLPYYRKDTGDKITIHHLLTHTNGLPQPTALPGFSSKPVRDPTGVQEFIKKGCSGDLLFEPGQQWAYSNSGYLLLGAIIEEVTGKTYEENLKELLFKPLDMHHSGYDRPGPDLKNAALGYTRGARGFQVVRHVDTYSTGALYSTVGDLYKLDRALYTDRLFPGKYRDMMFKPYIGYYGYGWYITSLDGRVCISHGGYFFGFAANIARYVDDDACIIVLANSRTLPFNRINRDLEAMLFGKPYQLPEFPDKSHPLSLPKETLEKYVGKYDCQGFIPEFILENGKLFAKIPGTPVPQMGASVMTENRVVIPDGDMQITFFEDERGEFGEIILNLGTINMKGKRIVPE